MKKRKRRYETDPRMSEIRKQYKSLMTRMDQKMNPPKVKELEKELYRFRLTAEAMRCELRTMIREIEKKQEWLYWGPDTWEVMDECLESLLDCLSCSYMSSPMHSAEQQQKQIDRLK